MKQEDSFRQFSRRGRRAVSKMSLNYLSSMSSVRLSGLPGGGGGSLAHKLATHPRPSTSKMNPKWRVAPCYIDTLNAVRRAKNNPKWRETGKK